jgi:hypothetical protein
MAAPYASNFVRIFEFSRIFCLEYDLLILESEQLGTSGWL